MDSNSSWWYNFTINGLVELLHCTDKYIYMNIYFPYKLTKCSKCKNLVPKEMFNLIEEKKKEMEIRQILNKYNLETPVWKPTWKTL